ncbi:MAG: hypothetical protein OEY38_18625, partial [Gammaproteobacteria bacterium]|nr:hypothetical protein [Gammaproteobacteria bacterium]
SATHILSTDICEACHSTTAWVPVITVDHNEVLGTCETCHPAPADHVAAGVTAACESCHSTITWLNPTADLPAAAAAPAPAPAAPAPAAGGGGGGMGH